MTDKQSQTSSQSSSADIEMKPTTDHGSLETNSGPENPSDLLESGSSTPVKTNQANVGGPSPSTSRSSVPTSPSVHPISGDKMIVTVAPFTGGPFSVTVNKRDTVEDLKKVVAKKLKVLKERICLLYRESQLSEGTLEDNHLVNGSRITLLPRAETGLLAQRPEQSVMQALESLNDNQVVDFLSGKAPLNLTMRLGDHMMLIQLQLSTVNSASSSKRARTSGPSTSTSRPTTGVPSPATSSSATSSSSIRTSTTPMNRSSPTPSSSSSATSSTFSTPSSSPSASPPAEEMTSQYRPKLDTRALTEASKNLTQTLKQLSSEVLTTRTDEDRPRKRPRSSGSSANGASSGSGASGGAIIESMHHHGKGVYSGTFSGTLNPALQDRNGQPKRDITTIIHILNDLLCAQYKNYSATATPSSASGSQPRTTKTASSSTATSAADASSSFSSKSTSTTSSSSKNPGLNIGSAPAYAEQPSASVPSSPFFAENRMFTSKSGFEPGTSNMFSGAVTPGDEQTVTRSKMEQLRRIMEERKARRRMRREQAAARAAQYSTSWSVKSSEARSTSPNLSSSGSSDNSNSAKTSGTGSNSASNGSGPNSSNSSSAASDIFNPELEPVTA